MTRLVVVVDAPAADGGAAALLPSEHERAFAEQPPPTVLRVLLEDGNAVGLGCVAALVREPWAADVRARLEDDVPIVPYDDAGRAARVLAGLVAAAPGPVVLAHGDLLLDPVVLAGAATDVRLGTAALAGPGGIRRGRVVEAGPDVPAGLLRVADRDRALLAGAAAGMAGPSESADPLGLLLAVAVRQGIAVAALPAGAGWARPRTADEADAAGARLRTARTRTSGARRVRVNRWRP